jgi:hypothetical protein
LLKISQSAGDEKIMGGLQKVISRARHVSRPYGGKKMIGLRDFNIGKSVACIITQTTALRAL